MSMSILTMTTGSNKREVLTHCSKLPLSCDTTLQWIGSVIYTKNMDHNNNIVDKSFMYHRSKSYGNSERSCYIVECLLYSNFFAIFSQGYSVMFI